MSSNMFAKLVNLLQETNRTIKHFQEKAKEKEELAHQWQKKYEKLLQLYLAKEFDKVCSDCQRLSVETEPGDTITLCQNCSVEKETIGSLKIKQKETEEKAAYWEELFHTASHHEQNDHGTD